MILIALLLAMAGCTMVGVGILLFCLAGKEVLNGGKMGGNGF